MKADRDLLDSMCRRAQSIKQDSDPKLTKLVEELTRIVEEAKNETVDDEDARQKEKC